MDAMRDALENRLREFYDHERIGIRHFGCPHRGLCEGALRAPLSHGSEAFVGSRYGELTKIAVISLDAAGESRSLDQQRKHVEAMEERTSATPMKETLRLLRKLLSKELDGNSPVPFSPCCMRPNARPTTAPTPSPTTFSRNAGSSPSPN